MNEVWVNLNGRNAARMLLKSQGAGRGVGLGRLWFRFDVQTRDELAASQPMWLAGTLQVRNLGASGGYLADLAMDNQPVLLPKLGESRDITFTANLQYAQVQVIEDHRSGPVALAFDFSGHWLLDDGPVPFWGCQLESEIKQSEWIAILEQIGHRRLMLLEIDAPDVDSSSAPVMALQYFGDAQRQYLGQEWRLTVESLRQCLAALVGKGPDDEDDDSEVRAVLQEVRKSTVTGRIGYAQRREPVRAALKFLCDLGAHPEVAETRKQDAHAAILMVAGLLQGFRNS
jgi:hypothetical protein